MMQLIQETDQRLKQQAVNWDFTKQFDAPVLEQQMLDLMRSNNGIGLAANQVGLLYRVFVMKLADGQEIGCFNPSILADDNINVVSDEGCLSFPNLWLKISRSNKITAMYLDKLGQRCIIELEGIDSRCFQHELDHLDGITFTEHVSDLKLKMARKKQRKLNG